MGGLGGNIDSLIGNLGNLGPDRFKDGKGDKSDRVNGDSSAHGGTDSQSSPKSRTGTWSGMRIQSNLPDEGSS
jgi:hypothetical protein